jgi:putative acetyltransferase
VSEPIIIRPLHLNDAVDWQEARTQPGVIQGTLQLLSLTQEAVRAQCISTPDNYVLAAQVGSTMVGAANIWVGTGRRRHSGDLGIAIHDQYHGLGVGRRLMAAILDVADNHLMLERVALVVYTDNERALRLYESMGFETEGSCRQESYRNGALADTILMGRRRGRAALAEPTAPPALPPRQTAEQAPPAGLTLRAIRAEDIPAIYKMLADPAVGEGARRLPTLQEEQVRQELSKLSRQDHVLVAELAGTAVGYGHLRQFDLRRSHSGQVQTLVVDPAYQGQGVGRALLQALVDLGERWLNLHRIEVHVNVSSPVAVALFQGVGFTVEAVERAAVVVQGAFTDLNVMARVRRPC